MTKIIHQTGDIFTSTAKALGHGVNVDGVMGHGIAVQFRDIFPDMHEAYKALCYGGHLKPGETMAWEVRFVDVDESYWVYNIASQDHPGRNASLEWLRDGVKAALIHAEKNEVPVLALPRIGSGIGGLVQEEVEAVLTELAAESPVDIEIWTYNK